MPKKQSKAILDAKREAKMLARTSDLSYCQILDERARLAGYGTWKALLDHNPSEIPEAPITPAPWNAVITFEESVNQDAWVADALIPLDEERTADEWSIPGALAWGDGREPHWRSDTQVSIGAQSHYHALAVLGVLPLGFLGSRGAALTIEGPSGIIPVPYVTPDQAWTDENKIVPTDVPLKPVVYPSIEGWDEDLLNSSPWVMLHEVFDGMYSDAGYLHEAIDDVSEKRQPGQSAILRAIAGSGAPMAYIFEGKPDPAEMRAGQGAILSTRWPELVQMGYTDDHDLEVFFSDEATFYMMHGLDWDLVARVEAGASPDDESPAKCSIEAWWRNRSIVGRDARPVEMGAPFIDQSRYAKTHPLDEPVHRVLAYCRSLGEMPVDDSHDRWPVTSDRTRRLALFGDFPQ